MTDEQIIKKWRSGATIEKISTDYMNEYNRRDKRIWTHKISKYEAQEKVEKIIFDFETKDWKRR